MLLADKCTFCPDLIFFHVFLTACRISATVASSRFLPRIYSSLWSSLHFFFFLRKYFMTIWAALSIVLYTFSSFWLISLSGLVQRCVIIQKDENGFGLTVSGDNPVFVQLVKEGKWIFFLFLSLRMEADATWQQVSRGADMLWALPIRGNKREPSAGWKSSSDPGPDSMCFFFQFSIFQLSPSVTSHTVRWDELIAALCSISYFVTGFVLLRLVFDIAVVPDMAQRRNDWECVYFCNDTL